MQLWEDRAGGGGWEGESKKCNLLQFVQIKKLALIEIVK